MIPAQQQLSSDQKVALLEGQLLVFAEELSELYRSEKSKSGELSRSLESLRENQVAFARSFALVIEGNDPDTRTHLDRTQRWGTAIAKRLEVPDLHDLQLGFLLHDIGKWSVPKEILLKPGPLNELEWRIMRTHPVAGAHMISDVPLLSKAVEVIRGHHERWDGGGYPYGVAGEQIPIGARIFTVADVFDALTSDRPYRAALPIEQATQMIREQRGTAFDPIVVDVFLELIGEVIARGDLPEADAS